jgi:hypothetical protein
MLSKLRPRLTYANVVSTLCLFLVVAGGTAYAADTVFSTDIVDGEVKTADLANAAVTNGKLKADSVTTGKVAADTLGAADLAPGSVGTSEVTDNSLTGADVDEFSLVGVAADSLDGGSLCRSNSATSLFVTETTGSASTTICTKDTLSVIAVCTHTSTTAVARLLLDSSYANAFVSSGVSDNPDLDAAEPPVTLASASNTSGGGGTVSTGDTSFSAGQVERRDMLNGSATVKATHIDSSKSECRFAVGATT